MGSCIVRIICVSILKLSYTFWVCVPVMIYPVDISWLEHRLKMYRIISTLIHKLFIILHIYHILTWIDHVLDIPRVIWARIDSSQDYVLQADLSWHQITLGMSTTRSIPWIFDTLVLIHPSTFSIAYPKAPHSKIVNLSFCEVLHSLDIALLNYLSLTPSINMWYAYGHYPAFYMGLIHTNPSERIEGL